MRPLAILQCVGKALVRQVGNAVGFGVAGDVVVGVGEEVWGEWKRDKDEQQRREELEALVRMAAQEFRRQVEEVVREVAAGLPDEVRRGVSRGLEELPEKLRRSLRRPDDPDGQSVPPGLPLREANDLASLLAGNAGPNLSPAARVTLTLADGPAKGRQFVSEERTQIIVGRDKDCHLRLPKDDQHRAVSRHHCLLIVNPPDVSVCDMNSVGGTYVNGELLGRRPKGMDRDEALNQPFLTRELKDGDELRLCKHGAAVFRVSVTFPAACQECGAWIPDDRKADCQRAAGVYQCESCRGKAAADQRPRPAQAGAAIPAWLASNLRQADQHAPPARACAGCGHDVAGEAGANRPGAFLCAACRNDQGRLVRGPEGAGPGGPGGAVAVQGYTILKELGRGGMGSVWLARHDRTRRLAAVKVMLPQVAAVERAVNRFLLEMNITRTLKHPNVVQVEDAGFSRGVFFLTLEYCQGGSAAHLMQQCGGALPLDQAVKITLQALQGLHYAHNVFGPGRGLVHRDLKPANLFLSGSGGDCVAKVGDYGLAKAFDDAGLSGGTRTGDKAGGTPGFMARQQVIDFKYAGPEVDVWAMAASLYGMLTGAVPRDFPKDRDPLLVVLETPPVPIRRRKSWLPKGLAEVIDRALVEEPEIPFKTAVEFKTALEGAL